MSDPQVVYAVEVRRKNSDEWDISCVEATTDAGLTSLRIYREWEQKHPLGHQYRLSRLRIQREVIAW